MSEPGAKGPYLGPAASAHPAPDCNPKKSSDNAPLSGWPDKRNGTRARPGLHPRFPRAFQVYSARHREREITITAAGSGHRSARPDFPGRPGYVRQNGPRRPGRKTSHFRACGNAGRALRDQRPRLPHSYRHPNASFCATKPADPRNRSCAFSLRREQPASPRPEEALRSLPATRRSALLTERKQPGTTLVGTNGPLSTPNRTNQTIEP